MRTMARTSLHVLIAGCFGIAWLAMLLIAPRAEAQAISSFSGTIIANEFDVNNDGVTGDTATTELRGSFGRGVSQSYVEFLPPDGTVCGADSFLFVHLIDTEVRTYANGDQLYLSLSDGSACLNVVDGSFTFELILDVTGGTGKFQGAMGSSTVMGSGQLVEPDPVRLSAVSGTVINDIVLAP